MFTVEAPLAEMAAELEATRKQFRQAIPRIVSHAGETLLDRTRQDYDLLSRGGQPAGRDPWRPLQRSTVAARVYSKAGRAIVDRRRQLARQIQAARGKGAPAEREQLRQQRADLQRELQATISTAMSTEKIGVHSGKLQASAKATVDGDTISISYANPSAAFGATRPILPLPMPKSWAEAAYATIQDDVDNLFPDS